MIAAAPTHFTLVDRPTSPANDSGDSRDTSATRATRETRATSRASGPAPMSLSRVVAALQIVLATRRAQHADDHGYWYSVARGL